MKASVTPRDEVRIKRFVTTGAGNVGGTTLVCSTLTDWPDFDGGSVIIRSGTYKGQGRVISGATTGGTITVTDAFGGQIASGVKFDVIGLPTTTADVAVINTKIGANTDAAGTTTLFARLRQIVDTYLADATIGLAALRTAILANLTAIGTVLSGVNTILTRIGTNADAAGTTTLFARLRQIVDTYLADGTIGLLALKNALNTLLGRVENFGTTQTGTLNDANTEDEITTTKSGARIWIVVSLANLANGDDFELTLSHWNDPGWDGYKTYKITKAAGEIYIDVGGGVTKQFIGEIAIENVFMDSTRKLKLSYLRNSGTGRDFDYFYNILRNQE